VLIVENKSIEIKKGIANLFDRVSSVFDGSGPRYFAYFGQRMVEEAGVKEGEKVLDVASGKGASLFSSAEKVGSSGEVIGIDIAEGMIKEINLEMERRAIQNTKAMVMDAEKLQFASESFDHVLCGFGVFFFPNYKVALEEFKRVLKKGGSFTFTTFMSKSDDKFAWLGELVDKYLPPIEDEYKEEDGPVFNTEEGLYKILKEAGFNDISVLCEEKTFLYKDEQEWWDKLWTHGFRRVLDAMPEDKTDNFKSEVFAKLKELKSEEGISDAMYVLYGFGMK
jgi:ubiquinone/menaquinone biosynthesis C-methylase UbiE